MKKITLTQGFEALVDDSDFEKVAQYKWHVDKRRHTNYARRSWRDENGTVRSQAMHCLILGIIGIDHIDGNGLNNLRSNLRPATQHQNNGNYKKRKGNSRFKGVCRATPSRTTWKAQIRHGDNKVRLGNFQTEEEAALAYDEAAREYFGEYAQLNFPDK